jgi:hypothetical protein
VTIHIPAIAAHNARTFLSTMLQSPQSIKRNPRRFVAGAKNTKNGALFG